MSAWQKKHFYPCACLVAFRVENGSPEICPAHGSAEKQSAHEHVLSPVGPDVCVHCGIPWSNDWNKKDCGGRFQNGPGKLYARCDRCGHVDWEANEGDRCTREVPT